MKRFKVAYLTIIIWVCLSCNKENQYNGFFSFPGADYNGTIPNIILSYLNPDYNGEISVANKGLEKLLNKKMAAGGKITITKDSIFISPEMGAGLYCDGCKLFAIPTNDIEEIDYKPSVLLHMGKCIMLYTKNGEIDFTMAPMYSMDEGYKGLIKLLQNCCSNATLKTPL